MDEGVTDQVTGLDQWSAEDCELSKGPSVSFGGDRGKRFPENHGGTPVADDDWQRQADGVATLLAEGLADENAFPDIRKAVRSFVGESNRLFGTGIEVSATTPSCRPDKTDKSPSVSSVSDQGRRVSENHVVPGTLEPVADPDRDFEERAAIAEHDGGLPKEIAEGLARLDIMRPPEEFGQSRWRLIVNDAALFADTWGARALALGWRPIELFGIHSEKPVARIDCRGLAFLLNGGKVVAMDSVSATIVTPNGTKQRHYRWQDNPGAKLAWA
jgi:hypothetical protein